MMTRTMTMRRKIAASVASAALAMSMVVAAPTSALAADNATDDLVAPGTALNVVNGQVSLCSSDYLDASYPVKVQNMSATAYHLDFKIDGSAANTAGASVNKHSGVLTTTSAGTATVIVNLVSGAKPTGNSGNPCTGYTVLDTETFTVSATASSAYTFQGNDLQIMMTSPAVSSFSGNGTNGWANSLDTLVPSNGTLTFNYSQTYGIGKNTIATYATTNAGKVLLLNSAGIEIKTLGNGITLSQQGTSKTELAVSFSTAGLSNGSYTLEFVPTYVAGNGTSTLGKSITFSFRISGGAQ